MKIWVTGTRGIPGIMGGVETHCANLLPRLVARGHEITVGCRRPYVTFTDSSYRGVALRTFGVLRSRSLEAILHTLRCVFAAWRDRAEVVHIHAVGPALAAPLVRMFGMKVVVTHHGFDYERDKWGFFARFVLRTGERVAARFASYIIAVSPHIAARLRQKYGLDEKVVVIPNGVEAPAVVQSVDRAPYILALGRFVEEKNFHTLIEAYRISRLKENGVSLIIAGDADMPSAYSRSLRCLAENAGVSLPGFISGEPLARLFAGASLFVIPSTHEGLPVVLLEAMSYGLPLLASDIPANRLPELPDNVFFNPGDCGGLSARLKSFFDNRGETCVSYDMSRYDWENIADATSTLYASLSPQTR